MKSAALQSDRGSGFIMKQNKVISVDYLSQIQSEIEELRQTYHAKLMPLTNKSLLVVGGKAEAELGGKMSQITVNRSVQEIYWQDMTGQWRTRQKDYMVNPRFSFGATFLRNKAYAFVSGGYSTAMQVIANCELYNVATNKWIEIPG